MTDATITVELPEPVSRRERGKAVALGAAILGQKLNTLDIERLVASDSIDDITARKNSGPYGNKFGAVDFQGDFSSALLGQVRSGKSDNVTLL